MLGVVTHLVPEDLPPALDVEVSGERTAAIAAGIPQWLDPIQQNLGRTRVMYTSASFTLAAIVAFGILLPIASGDRLPKVKLPPPGNHARIEGKLRGMEDHKESIFRADRDAKVKMALAGAGPMRGEVIFPRGPRRRSGGSILDRPLPETGEHQVRVSESAVGETWEGSFMIEISVAQ